MVIQQETTEVVSYKNKQYASKHTHLEKGGSYETDYGCRFICESIKGRKG